MTLEELLQLQQINPQALGQGMPMQPPPRLPMQQPPVTDPRMVNNPQIPQLQQQMQQMDAPHVPSKWETIGQIGQGLSPMDPAQFQQIQQEKLGQEFAQKQIKRQNLAQQIQDMQNRQRQGQQDVLGEQQQQWQRDQEQQRTDIEKQRYEQQIAIQNRPKAFGGNAPGDVYGTEDPTTGERTVKGTVANRPEPPRPIDRFSPEGIAAQQKIDANRPKPVSTAQPDYEWVTRGGKPVQIRKGTAQAGDKPYDTVTERQQTIAGGESPYSKERAFRTVQSVDELAAKVNGWNTGVGSLMAGIPATDSRDFKAELDTLKANIAFNELAQMRNASKTGGALGQVSDKEGQLLQSALGALDTGQSTKNFKEQLQKVKGAIERWSAAMAAQSSPSSAGPKVGDVEDGHVFLGGDPAKPESWKKQ